MLPCAAWSVILHVSGISLLRRSVTTFGIGYKPLMRMNGRPNLVGPEYCALSQPGE